MYDKPFINNDLDMFFEWVKVSKSKIDFEAILTEKVEETDIEFSVNNLNKDSIICLFN